MRHEVAKPRRVASTPAVPVSARLMSRSDVKRTQCVGRSQNRQLVRGGRA